MKILLTGITGQLGSALAGTLAPLGELVAVDRSKLDLCDLGQVRAIISSARPDVLVNAAAYTMVDEAESRQDLAYAVNARAVEAMARAARELGAVLVSYSTDYVFDGRSTSAYVENDSTSPLNVYGASKLAGEQAIAASGCAHLILRTSWVYSASGRNFFTTIARLAGEQPELRVVNDQVGAPTWAHWIAFNTAGLLRTFMSRRDEAEVLSGVYHMTAAGQTSWFGFASAIVDALGVHRMTRPPRVVPVPSTEYASPAVRPAHSVLDNAKLRRVFGVQQTEWQAQLAHCVQEWSSQRPKGSGETG